MIAPLREFAPDLWTVDGPIVRAFAIPFDTRAIVVRLGDGSLWINSPVEATPAEMQSLTALGPVRYLVAPTPLHTWRLGRWAEFFPEAQLWLPPQRRSRRATPAGHVLSDEPPAAWSAEIDQLVFKGSFILDEVYFLHRKSRTLIFGDFIQTYRAEKGRYVRNALLKWLGVLDGGVGIDIRLSFAGNRSLGRRSLERLLAWDFDNLILAHGDCVVGGAKLFVERAFRWLSR